MDELLDIEDTLIELYEAGMVTYEIGDDGITRWSLTPIAERAMELGLISSE